MIKAQSLEVTLPAIIFTHNIYMSLLEQDHQEGAGVREPYKIYKMYKIYKNATRTTKSKRYLGQYDFRNGVRSRPPRIPGSLHWQFNPWKLNNALIPTHAASTSESSTHPSYNIANSSVFQATATCSVHKRVVISYRRYEYNDDLSEESPVIDTSTITT